MNNVMITGYPRAVMPATQQAPPGTGTMPPDARLAAAVAVVLCLGEAGGAQRSSSSSSP
jgi:hypothetical protein